MYAAKETHQAILEYTTDLAHFSPERLALVSQLRHAISADELVLHYQPKLDLRPTASSASRRCCAGSTRRAACSSPAEFLEIAESTGLIDPLTDWVLDHAIAQLARVARAGHDARRRGQRLGAQPAQREPRRHRVRALLAEHEVAAEYLEIEITETALIADPIRATQRAATAARSRRARVARRLRAGLHVARAARQPAARRAQDRPQLRRAACSRTRTTARSSRR